MRSGNLARKETYIGFWDFAKMGRKETYIVLGKTARSAAKKNKVFRHKNEFLKGETWYFRACRAKRGEKILHDFQRFLGPKRNLHGFWKTRILARKGTYIKSRFWILKGGFLFGSAWYASHIFCNAKNVAIFSWCWFSAVISRMTMIFA